MEHSQGFQNTKFVRTEEIQFRLLHKFVFTNDDDIDFSPNLTSEVIMERQTHN